MPPHLYPRSLTLSEDFWSTVCEAGKCSKVHVGEPYIDISDIRMAYEGNKRPRSDGPRGGGGKPSYGGGEGRQGNGDSSGRPTRGFPSRGGSRGGGGGGGRGGFRGGGRGSGGGGRGGGRGGFSNGGSRGGYSGGGGGYKGKPKEEADEKPVYRKRPITATGPARDMDDEDEDMSSELEDGGEVEEVPQDGEPAEKKPRLSKAEKAALHAAQPHRTTLLPSHGLLQELLPLWEPARRADISKEERNKAIKELWAVAKGRVGEISRGHKGGRVLQTVRAFDGVVHKYQADR